MGKKKGQQNKQKSNWIPPVANGGIKKKNHTNQPTPSFVIPNYPQPNRYQLPGFPILPFPVQLVSGPSISAPPSILSTPSVNPPLFPTPPSTGHPVVIPSLLGSQSNPVQKGQSKTSNKTPNKKRNTGVIVSTPKGLVTEVTKTKAQLKYARQLATRAKKRKVSHSVKKEPKEHKFNMFMNIAERYHVKTSDVATIDIQDEIEDDDDEVEEIEQEEREDGKRFPLAETPSNEDVTIVDDMSICTVDEEGEGEDTMGSIDTIDEVGEETMVQQVKEEEKEGEIILDEEEEDDDDDIQCIGEKKATGRVMSMVDLIEGSDVEEIENESNEASLMDKAFTEEQSLPPMEQSIIDLSLDEDNEETTKKIASGSELPDFIPLIDDKKKNEKGKQPQFVQPVKNGVTRIQNGSSSSFPLTAPSSPLIIMSRTKSAKERKREAYRKKAETRAMSLSGSPCTIARSISSSTCSFPPFPQPFFSPSSIPLPGGPIPPSPLSHLLRFPSGSVPSMTSLASMGLIHTRGISTSAPQSQPVNFGDYSVPPPPLVRGMGGSCSTLASVLQEEAAGIVRDSLSSSGIYRRQWETECPYDSSEKIDPSSAPFRICSYNVLCQKTISATEYLYRHTKFQPHVLRWAHRWPLIQKELMELNADVFGLQEIQDVHFEEFYEPFMKSLGYICHYQPKSEAFHSDGLGIFVRANRFKITSSNVVDFLVPGDNLMNRGNVAQLLRLECLQTGASLIITNTHIIFNEKRGDVKLGQIALLMANIHAIRQGDEPVICLGDWNLEPKSDLYNYITNGSLDANQFVARYGSGQLREGRNFSFTPMRELPIDTHLKTKMSRDGILYQNEGTLLQSLQRSQPSILSHQIPLASTYAPYRERHVSTFHKDVANPDFIFYTTAGRGETDSRRLRLIRRLGVPLENGIKRNMEPWPNHYVPSDHIPLVAEFYLAK